MEGGYYSSTTLIAGGALVESSPFAFYLTFFEKFSIKIKYDCEKKMKHKNGELNIFNFF